MSTPLTCSSPTGSSPSSGQWRCWKGLRRRAWSKLLQVNFLLFNKKNWRGLRLLTHDAPAVWVPNGSYKSGHLWTHSCPSCLYSGILLYTLCILVQIFMYTLVFFWTLLCTHLCILLYTFVYTCVYICEYYTGVLLYTRWRNFPARWFTWRFISCGKI